MNSQISDLFDMPIFVLKSLVGFIIYPLRFSSLFFLQLYVELYT